MGMAKQQLEEMGVFDDEELDGYPDSFINAYAAQRNYTYAYARAEIIDMITHKLIPKLI